MSDTRSLRTAVTERFIWSVFVVLTTATVLQADHNKMLQREYRAAIGRHVACDSQGYCYLLVPSSRSEGARGFALQVSRKPHPQQMSDFSVTVPFPTQQEPTAASVFSAGLSVDSKDRLHLIWTTEEGPTAYSVMETESLRSGNGEAEWLHPVSGQKGGLIVAPRQSWAGDICRAADGRVWLTWTTDRENHSEVTVHLGTLRDGAWQSFELGRGKKF